MIELNLLPEELKRKKKKIELPDIPIIPIAAGLVSLLVVIQLILGGLISLNQKKLTLLDKKWQELEPKKAELDKIKHKTSDLSKKNQAVEALMLAQLNWSRILNELSNSMTSNVWLTSLTYGEKTERSQAPPKQKGKKTQVKQKTVKIRSLALSGVAFGKGGETTAHIARFIKALKDNNNFYNAFETIELVGIKKGIIEGQDVMNFDLLCKFKPEKLET